MTVLTVDQITALSSCIANKALPRKVNKDFAVARLRSLEPKLADQMLAASSFEKAWAILVPDWNARRTGT